MCQDKFYQGPIDEAGKLRKNRGRGHRMQLKLRLGCVAFTWAVDGIYTAAWSQPLVTIVLSVEDDFWLPACAIVYRYWDVTTVMDSG